MTAVISDFSRVDDAWRKFVSRRLLKPGHESPYIMEVRLDGVGALAGLFEVFLVVSDYIFVSNHLSLSIIIWPVFAGLRFSWNLIIWPDYTITVKIMGIIWHDYIERFWDNLTVIALRNRRHHK
jgi:hypothetical protein